MLINTELKNKNSRSILIVSLEGELTLNNANNLRETIKDHISEGNTNILIDFDKVSYIDSAGIGVLVASLAYLKKQDGELRISSLIGNVRKIFEFSKLDLAFSIFPNKEEAILSWN